MASGKTILLYTDESTPGGVAHYNHSLLPALLAAGWRTVSAQPPNESPMLTRQRELGVEQYFFSYEPMTAFSRSFTDTSDPVRIMAEVKPHLVYFSDCCPLSNIAAKHVAITQKIPFAVISHSGADYLAQKFPACLPVVKQQLGLAEAVVAISQKNLDILRSHFGLAQNKGTVVMNGRPAAFFAPRNPDVRRQIRVDLGIPQDAVLCFTSARFDVAKGYQHQLAAINKLQARRELGNLHFAWAGTGELHAQIDRAVKTSGLDSRVHLLGQRWDIAELLDASDLFVLTTMLEGGLPLSVMEAMAKGVATVVTAVSGISEVAGDACYLLPDPNTQAEKTALALADALIGLSKDSARREKIAQIGRALAEREFRQETNLEKTIHLLEGSLRPNSPTSSSSSSQRATEVSAGSANAEQAPLKVSIILSGFEAAKHAGCLENLKAQTLFKQGQMEIIVVVAQAASDLKSQHPKVIFVPSEKKLPAYAALNQGIRTARGSYIACIEPADRHRANAFELMSLALDERTEVALVYSDSDVTSDEGTFLDATTAEGETGFMPDFFPPSALLYFQFGTRALWRRSIHNQIGLFDETLITAGAHDFNLRFAQHFTALHLPFALGSNVSCGSLVTEAAAGEERSLVLQRYRTDPTIEALYQQVGVSTQTAAEKSSIHLDLGLRAAGAFWIGGVPRHPDPQFALQCFVRAIELDPTQPAAVNNLFCLLAMTGHADEGFRLLESRPEIHANNSIQQNIQRVRRAVASSESTLDLEFMAAPFSFPTEQELFSSED
jgi:glycosyltransferase involved in cell wall biosynthesis